jgi:hypothetical protein
MTLDATRDLVDLIDREPKSERKPVAVSRCSICQTMSRTGDWCGVCGELRALLGREDMNNTMGVDPDD